MDIQAAAFGSIQHGLWQDQAISRDDGCIQFKRAECCLHLGMIAQAAGRADGQASSSAAMCTGLRRIAWPRPAGRAGWLVDGRYVMAGVMQRQQGGNGKIRAAHESDAHGTLSPSIVRLLCAAPSPGDA